MPPPRRATIGKVSFRDGDADRAKAPILALGVVALSCRPGYLCRTAPSSGPVHAAFPIRNTFVIGHPRSDSAPTLVRPPPPRPAVARPRRRPTRPLPRLAQRNHASADDGSDCRPIFRPIRGTLARCFGARRGIARRDTSALAGARLLRARPQPACVRTRGCRAAWRQVPERPGGVARTSWDRVLQRGGDCRYCLRSANTRDRR